MGFIMSSKFETSLVAGSTQAIDKRPGDWLIRLSALSPILTRNDKKHIGYPRVDPKMIDNLFNSFTCHAVLGNGLGFSPRNQHKPNKFYGG
jgi:hypothetical protein